jgi:hypothetical protein
VPLGGFHRLAQVQHPGRTGMRCRLARRRRAAHTQRADTRSRFLRCSLPSRTHGTAAAAGVRPWTASAWKARPQRAAGASQPQMPRAGTAPPPTTLCPSRRQAGCVEMAAAGHGHVHAWLHAPRPLLRRCSAVRRRHSDSEAPLRRRRIRRALVSLLGPRQQPHCSAACKCSAGACVRGAGERGG